MRTLLMWCLSVLCFAHLQFAPAFPAQTRPEDYLTDYHDSGQYYQDISAVIKEATCYLQFRLTQNERAHDKRKLAIVLDIDETAISNYEDLSKQHFIATEWATAILTPSSHKIALPHTLALYNYARTHHVDVFFITTRSAHTATLTQKQLYTLGYRDWRQIIFSPDQAQRQDYHYYAAERQKIINAGYDIILNIGSQSATLSGGLADMTFRLPNPFYAVH